ncbi:MAG: hypothetical protein AB1555_02580 [Nitrospirota bacterium]
MGTLTDFLREKQKARSPERQARRRKKYLDAVDAFFEQVRSWLAEAQREKLVKVHEDKIKITEEALGAYTAPCLRLTAAGKTVKLRPIGSTIIGADGRVDMESVNGTYMFLYFADQEKWVYGMGRQPAEFPELTEDLFTDLLKRALV